ncbi:UNVERIFIED_CONTAM: hypothetical protein K2H54_046842, partial [Gekko kuhli]
MSRRALRRLRGELRGQALPEVEEAAAEEEEEAEKQQQQQPPAGPGQDGASGRRRKPRQEPAGRVANLFELITSDDPEGEPASLEERDDSRLQGESHTGNKEEAELGCLEDDRGKDEEEVDQLNKT